MNLKKLPIEGSVLKEIVIYGNAKDCTVCIKTKNPDRETKFEVQDPQLHIDLHVKVNTTIFNDGDDNCLGIRYLPTKDTKLEICEIDYPSTDTEWLEELEHLQSGQDYILKWLIDYANLRLTPITG